MLQTVINLMLLCLKPSCPLVAKNMKLNTLNNKKLQQQYSICVCVCVCVCACARACARVRVCPHACTRAYSVISDSATAWTVACQAPLSMGFPRQEYQSGLPLPLPGIFPTQGSNPHLVCFQHWQTDCLPLSHFRNMQHSIVHINTEKCLWGLEFGFVF